MLELLAVELGGDDSPVVVVETHPWEYDPATDPKATLIAEVLGRLHEELDRRKKLSTKVKEKFKALARRVQISKAVKLAVTSAATGGLPPLADVLGLFDDNAETVPDPTLQGFREEFAELMAMDELADISRVVVLVDDLDRCLPGPPCGLAGVGGSRPSSWVHPAIPNALQSFDEGKFVGLLARTPLIGEVGLDCRSKAAKALQLDVFRRVLDVANETPRLVSIHSAGMSAEVLAELARRPISGAILHWWRGDAQQTARAVELGCYFSLNGAEISSPKVLSLVPEERVLTETDFPHTKRSDNAADKPGAVATTESGLAEAWGTTLVEVRQRIWENLAQLCETTRTASLMPRDTQATLLAL